MARRPRAVIAAVAGLLLMVVTAPRRSVGAPPPPGPTPPTPPGPPPTPSSRSTPTPSSSPAPSSAPLRGTSVVPGGSVSQHSHTGHEAIDISAREGTPVYSAMAGVVRAVYPNGSTDRAGNTVALSHDGRSDGTVYMHLQAFREGLRVGQRVAQYELLGTVGRTDSSADDGVFSVSGPHLHFAVLGPLAVPQDVARFRPGFPGRLDPEAWARAQGVSLTGRS
jgi:murein DD-endopeptidase MepM/ murein hydrolase activator NlpD